MQDTYELTKKRRSTNARMQQEDKFHPLVPLVGLAGAIVESGV